MENKTKQSSIEVLLTVSVGHVILPTINRLVVVSTQVVSSNEASFRTLFLDPCSVSYSESVPSCITRSSSKETSEDMLCVLAVGVPLVLVATLLGTRSTDVLAVHFRLLSRL